MTVILYFFLFLEGSWHGIIVIIEVLVGDDSLAVGDRFFVKPRLNHSVHDGISILSKLDLSGSHCFEFLFTNI
jgi:hypothetical protein